jgi:hypothetical protein
MSADGVPTTRTDKPSLQAHLAWILDAVRRLGDAIRDLPNTHREWPGGR